MIQFDRIIPKTNIHEITNDLLMPSGRLILLKNEQYNKYTQNEIQTFCVKCARYGLPTYELIQFLKEEISDRSCIEIGAGSGDLGYYLGIKMTDLKIQEEPLIKLYYQLNGQEPVRYPKDVEKLDPLEAVKKYKPEVVLACWVTQYQSGENWVEGKGNIKGVKESFILKKIKKYILIGNLKVHGHKDIMALPHKELKLDFLRSRASCPDLDRVFI